MIFKKLLSAVLAAGMLLGIMPVTAEEAVVDFTSGDTVYYTDVFEGNPTYLIEDPFSSPEANTPDDGKDRPSGWDVEYRGGGVGMFIYRTDSDPVYGQGKRFDTNLQKNDYEEYFAAPYFNNGHFMVPLLYMCELLEVSVTNEKVEAQETVPYCYEFNVDNNFQKWIRSNFAYTAVVDGTLLLKSSTKDPMIRQASINLDASKYKYVKVRMKNMTGATTPMVYFITDTDKTWNRDKSVSVSATSTEEYVEYVFDMSTCPLWKGTINTLRFDPTMELGNVYIDYIRVE